MRILLTADEAAGLQTLRLLLSGTHTVSGVITTSQNRAIRKLAEEYGLPIYASSLLCQKSFAEQIREDGVDVLLNVHLLRIVHPDVVEAPRFGAFNLHPGPLPDYAGLNTPSWAIFQQETQFGVSLHWMGTGIDTGPVAYRSTLPVRPGDTGLTLSARCASAGLKLISELLNELSKEQPLVPAEPQELSRRRYFGKGERPLDGYIDWHRPASEIDALMRAYTYAPYPSPWGTLKSTYRGERVEIGAISVRDESSSSPPGTVEAVSDAGVDVASADRLVRITSCRKEGKRVDHESVFERGGRFTRPALKRGDLAISAAGRGSGA